MGADNPVLFFRARNPLSGAIQDLVVKHLREDTTAADAPAREFGMLESLHGHPLLRGQGADVPRPLARWDDLRTLVMERAPGRRLPDVLRRDNRLGSPAAKRRLADLMDQCGACLRALHQIGQLDAAFVLDDRQGPLNDLAFRLRGAIDKSRRQGLFEDGAQREMNRLIDTAIAELAGRRVTRVRAHGDYYLGNLLSDGRTLWLIDFGFSRPGLIHHDLSRFLLSLRTINPYPENLLYDFAAPGVFRQRFLSAYFGDSAQPAQQDRLLLSLFSLSALLYHYLRRARLHADGAIGARLYLRLLRPVYRRLLRQTLTELRTSLSDSAARRVSQRSGRRPRR